MGFPERNAKKAGNHDDLSGSVTGGAGSRAGAHGAQKANEPGW